MSLLSDMERQSAAADVRELIVSSGQEATLLRKRAGEHLYGSDDEPFAEVGSFKVEFIRTPPRDLTKQVDALASVLPELDVRVEDRVRFADCDYRVQTITPQSLFGVVTHKVLELVTLHGD